MSLTIGQRRLRRALLAAQLLLGGASVILGAGALWRHCGGGPAEDEARPHLDQTQRRLLASLPVESGHAPAALPAEGAPMEHVMTQRQLYEIPVRWPEPVRGHELETGGGPGQPAGAQGDGRAAGPVDAPTSAHLAGGLRWSAGTSLLSVSADSARYRLQAVVANQGPSTVLSLALRLRLLDLAGRELGSEVVTVLPPQLGLQPGDELGFFKLSRAHPDLNAVEARLLVAESGTLPRAERAVPLAWELADGASWPLAISERRHTLLADDASGQRHLHLLLAIHNLQARDLTTLRLRLSLRDADDRQLEEHTMVPLYPSFPALRPGGTRLFVRTTAVDKRYASYRLTVLEYSAIASE